MSTLLWEAFNHAPNAVFTLEATTPRSRDVYKHHRFEVCPDSLSLLSLMCMTTRQVVREVVVGKGKANALGLKSSGDAATGFPFYPMIKMP